jgi:hypothetical protein
LGDAQGAQISNRHLTEGIIIMESAAFDTARRDYLRTHPRSPEEDVELEALEARLASPGMAPMADAHPAVVERATVDTRATETSARTAEMAARAKTEKAEAAAHAKRAAARQQAEDDATRLDYLRSADPRTPEQTAELEAMEKRIAADKETEQKARLEGPMHLWLVHALDPMAPPFHFANVPHSYVVAARTPSHARDIAAAEAGDLDLWRDDMATACVPLKPREPGVIATDDLVRHLLMEDET